jgi:hypothetical protein
MVLANNGDIIRGHVSTAFENNLLSEALNTAIRGGKSHVRVYEWLISRGAGDRRSGDYNALESAPPPTTTTDKGNGGSDGVNDGGMANDVLLRGIISGEMAFVQQIWDFHSPAAAAAVTTAADAAAAVNNSAGANFNGNTSQVYIRDVIDATSLHATAGSAHRVGVDDGAAAWLAIPEKATLSTCALAIAFSLFNLDIVDWLEAVFPPQEVVKSYAVLHDAMFDVAGAAADDANHFTWRVRATLEGASLSLFDRFSDDPEKFDSSTPPLTSSSCWNTVVDFPALFAEGAAAIGT